MASDIFGGLGGIMKGLSGFMPQDNPDIKLMNAQTEVNEQKKRLSEIYARIGETAIERYGMEAFIEYADKLKLAQNNLIAAEEYLKSAKEEKEAKELEEKEKMERETCSECGAHNPDGVKFCQECGAKLGSQSKNLCVKCGAELAEGTRFCGECGARQPGV